MQSYELGIVLSLVLEVQIKKIWGKIVKQFAHKVCKVAELQFPSNPGNWGGGDFFLQMAWKFYNLNKKIRPIRGNFKYGF